MLTLLEESAVSFQLELFIVQALGGLGGRCPPSLLPYLPLSLPHHILMEHGGRDIYGGKSFKGVTLNT